MKKPNVLFVTEKWADCNPNYNLSNTHHNLFGSLECSELATYNNFFFEDNPNHIDEALITYHRRMNPDLTVITILPHPSAKNPTTKAFKEISKKSPIAFVWWDCIHPHIMAMVNQHSDYSSANILLDNPLGLPNEKNLCLWTPQDTRIYNNPNLERHIDVSFMGSTIGYKDRTDTLNHLISRCGANIYRGGGQREERLSPKDYAEVMKKSKISLSFSRTKEGILQQSKGRTWEVTLCGAMLMEDVCQATNLWFEPMKDYVPFTCPQDLTDKVNYYLSNPEKMAEIVNNGTHKATYHYNPKNWWSMVFNKCGVKI